MKIEDIRIFIPAKDYEISKAFYQSLGFRIDYVSDELSLCENGQCTFFLQDFYNEDLAKNLMFQLIVSDINAALDLIANIKIEGVRFEPIVEERWGRIIYLWGPSGELLHVTELKT
jgi:hypothetical protein